MMYFLHALSMFSMYFFTCFRVSSLDDKCLSSMSLASADIWWTVWIFMHLMLSVQRYWRRLNPLPSSAMSERSWETSQSIRSNIWIWSSILDVFKFYKQLEYMNCSKSIPDELEFNCRKIWQSCSLFKPVFCESLNSFGQRNLTKATGQ